MRRERPAPWSFRVVEKFLLIPRTLQFWPVDLFGKPLHFDELNFPADDSPRERRWLERASIVEYRVAGTWRHMFWYETFLRPTNHPNCRCSLHEVTP